MTLARDLLPLNLEITPMQVADTLTQPVGRWQGVTVEQGAQTTDCNLVLHPGEPSEILVKLENSGHTSLHLQTNIDGNFPSQWCQLQDDNEEDSEDLLPGATRQVVLHFDIPQDILEGDDDHNTPPRLDFSGRLMIAYQQENGMRSSQVVASFNLYLRPRSLYLNFLPELYREVDFIGRLLAIFEQSFEPVVQSLDVLWAYLDPRTAPEQLLPFLAHWVGWTIDPHLGLAQQRYLIRYAIELYRWRGTRRGLRFYLYLYTHLPLDEHLPEDDKHISIQESFSPGLILGQARFGDDAIIGGGQLYHFTVRLRSPSPDSLDQTLIRKIINQEKPAFCTYDLHIESVNTSLSRY